MTDLAFELTRRKILAGLGTIGVASAGAGLGTSAYFSDEESFKNNQLVAGELDLMVDWQEHYSDWSEDENDDVVFNNGMWRSDPDEFDDDLDDDSVDDFEVLMTGGNPGQVPDGYVGFPTFDEPLIAVPEDAVDDFLANTATEAFPDGDDDGIQDPILSREQLASLSDHSTEEEVEEAFHAQFANVPDDLEKPVIQLEDLKPGDFGEVTFSTHLQNNPGYLWMTGRLLDANENGVNEPEGNDPDEEEGIVELLDEVQAAIWYDDGDNVWREQELIRSPHDVEDSTNITLSPEDSFIARGSLRQVLELLGNGAGVALDADPTTGPRDCYPNSTTYHFGFAWWLPLDHGNEVQTDSVSFDLGFYTEQCRHNDGSGMTDAIDLSTGIADWQVVESPDDATGQALMTVPHPAWTTAPCASWIDPYDNPPEETDPVGEYAYELEFEVEGSSPVDTVVIERYGADNSVELFLDGTSLGGSAGANAFSSLREDIEPIRDLSPGTHTLRAEVVNNPGNSRNPTGLLVCARLK